MTPIFARVPDLDTGDDRFTILRCGVCGVASTDPYPSAATIQHLYETGATDYELPQAGIVGRLKDAFADIQIRAIRGTLPGGSAERILDYGTGGGRYAAACARIFPGASVVGTDFAPAPPAGSYYDGSRAIRYLPYAGLQAEAPFDLILARHVLEHYHDPIGIVGEWLDKLRSGGVLYLEVPNLDSRTARLLGKRWPLLYVPKHLSHFDRATLERVVREAGGHATIGHTEIPMMGNVLAIACNADRYDPRFRVFGLALHWLQLLIERSSGEGTCLTAAVRRPVPP